MVLVDNNKPGDYGTVVMISARLILLWMNLAVLDDLYTTHTAQRQYDSSSDTVLIIQ